MTDDFSRDEKMALKERLNGLVYGDVIKLSKLQRDFEAWARENNRLWASDETLRSWMTANFDDGNNPGWNSERVRSFRAFLRTRPDLNPNKAAALVHLLENHFRAPHAIPHDYLNSLCGGPFAMFRRLWSKPESGLFLRTIVTFTHDDGVLLYEEKEDFFDPVKSIQRYEIHNGPVLIFGYNLYILARGNDGVHCLKFLAIHDSDPLINGKTKTAICRGNMIAVTGRGPHPGFKFVLKRIAEGEDEGSRVVEANALDDDTRNYLAG